MGASVKIMLSYDYCHFEVCKGTDQPLSNKEINELRKDVQKLADEAVRQYRIAKDKYGEQLNKESDKEIFERRCKRIKEENKTDLSPEEQAMLKAYEDGSYVHQFSFDPYNYEDDEETPDFEDYEELE